ncbi:MAG: 3-oxoacyl-(acyl-carrier-protein) reductase [Thermomicrobiales bacterium]|nr:3-oxoacyl-(acyl-carrier-protein) reductase [Thermomicrobiales bacterium]
MNGRGELDGQVAMVTGAGSGIGRAIAHALANAGARVAVTDIDLEAAQQVALEVPGTIPMFLDVTSPESAKTRVAEVEAALGPLDILINNAGVSTMNRIQDLTVDEWDFNFDVNARGVFLVTQAALPGMIARRAGCIVNTASMAGKKAVPLLAHYAASKWACIGFTLSAAVELGPYGIRVNCVCPGYVETSMQERELVWEGELRGMSPVEIAEGYIRLTPLGRMETAEDVANVVRWLCSPAAEFVTGAVIDVTGGSHLT